MRSPRSTRSPSLRAIAEIKGGIEGAKSLYSADTGNVEALWLNNAKFPFDSVAVRQAIGYSIDRDAIVARLFGDLGVNKAVQTLNPPIVSKYADTTAYSNYVLSLSKVTSLMTGDGWTKSGGYWTKGGKQAAFVIKSTAGNKRRELTEQILQEQLKAAGFKLTIQNPSADDLFGKILAAGNYQMSLYAQTATSLEPGPLLHRLLEEHPGEGQPVRWPELAAHQHPDARPAAAHRRHQLRAERAHHRLQAGRPDHGAGPGEPPARPAAQHRALEQQDLGSGGRQPAALDVLEHERMDRVGLGEHGVTDMPLCPGSAPREPSPGHIRGAGSTTPRC